MAALALLLATFTLLTPTAHGQEQQTTERPATVAAIALSIRSRAIQDSRCYLMNGGAVESFFISEDTPVGSIIGTLSVNGDPGPEGDITLRLQEVAAAVGIAANTKNLTLLRPLDREERRGPSNVYVNVRCDRRRTTDPSFVIPVSVRVWDVNDNAPEWEGAPYAVRVSELTAVGATLLRTAARDRDQPGPHATLHYAVLPGPHSDLVGFLNELDSSVVVKKPLDYETLHKFTVTLRAQDQGSPPLHNDTTLTVDILDADDQNPKFTHEHYTAVIPRDAKPGTILETHPGPISAVDQDTGINAPLTYSLGGEVARALAVDRDTGRLSVAGPLDHTAPVTLVLKAMQVDNPDRYALATVSLGVEPAPPVVRFTRPHYSAQVREDTAPGAVLLTLHTSPAREEGLQFFVSERSFLDKFAINGAGQLLLRRPLDHEVTPGYHYQVMVTDGVYNDTATINITVLNVNEWEPRFRYPQYEFRVDDVPDSVADGDLLPVGCLDVFDGDRPDRVTLSLRGPHASLLQLSQRGELQLRAAALRSLNTSLLRALATARDTGTPPKQTSVPVLVHVSPRLLAGAAMGAGAEAGAGAGAGRGALVAIFAAGLALLALLVCALLLYIYRNKRRSKAAMQNKSPSGFVAHEKPRSATVSSAGGTAGGGAGAGAGAGAPSGSLLSVSAGASTILANSTSSLDLRAGDSQPARSCPRASSKSKVAPLGPSGAGGPAGGAAGGAGGALLMSDHLARSPGRSGVAWPAHTIPARLTALAWDPAPQDSGEEAREKTDNTDHMNLTVYF